MKKTSPQIKILNSLLSRGGTASTKEISQDINRDLTNVRNNSRHLVYWRIIKVKHENLKTGYKNGGHRNVYSINPTSLHKARSMVAKAYGTVPDVPLKIEEVKKDVVEDRSLQSENKID